MPVLHLNGRVTEGGHLEVQLPEDLPPGEAHVIIEFPDQLSGEQNMRHRSSDIRAQFEKLAAEWRQATRFVSSLTEMIAHPAYQRIVGMGAAVVPLLLERLRLEPDHWFWALKSITGEDPVPDEARGDLRAMGAAWLAWGRRHGYLSAV